MSVEFSNAYQEILFDNLVSIIKQNFMFQTQLKLAEDTGKVKEELQAKYNELANIHEVLKGQLGEAEKNKAKLDATSSVHEEKSRLQSALNDTMKKYAALEKQIEKMEVEVQGLKSYIDKLENIATPSKLKKLNPEKFAVEDTPAVTEEPAPQNLFAIKVNDGSSF